MTFFRLEGQDLRPEWTHRLRRLLVCVLCCKVLQHFLVVAAVDTGAVDLQDDLAGLKPRPRRLTACKVCPKKRRVRGQRGDRRERRKDNISSPLFVLAQKRREMTS